MDLLEKFEGVEICTENQISEEDRQFCTALKNGYDNARESLSELLFIWEDVLEEQEKLLIPTGRSHHMFISPNASVCVSRSNIQDCLVEMHKTFIKEIFSYFQRQYHVRLSEYDAIRELLPQKPRWLYQSNYEQEMDAYEEKIAVLILTCEQVLEAIFKEMGGRSLSEYAVFQIKDDCWGESWRRGNALFERDKQTVKLLSAVNSSFEIYESTRKIIKALAYFENGTPGTIPHELTPLFGYRGPGYNSLDFEDMTKITRMRLFKNGRLDIRFTEEAYAVQFVTEYLGTMPRKEAA